MLTHKSIDRRSLIAAGTVALGAGMICATAKADMAWDKETDVVVIGCGYAGACAAISALDEGASVIVLEKAPVVGGSSYVAVGTIHTAIRYDDVDAFIQTLDHAVAASLIQEGRQRLVDRSLHRGDHLRTIENAFPDLMRT